MLYSVTKWARQRSDETKTAIINHSQSLRIHYSSCHSSYYQIGLTLLKRAMEALLLLYCELSAINRLEQDQLEQGRGKGKGRTAACSILGWGAWKSDNAVSKFVWFSNIWCHYTSLCLGVVLTDASGWGCSCPGGVLKATKAPFLLPAQLYTVQYITFVNLSMHFYNYHTCFQQQKFNQRTLITHFISWFCWNSYLLHFVLFSALDTVSVECWS